VIADERPPQKAGVLGESVLRAIQNAHFAINS
jgi:hypothetical protein